MCQRGSISVLTAALLVLVAITIAALGHLGAQSVKRGRAMAIADVVAMAAAADPQAAVGVAEANSATFVSLLGVNLSGQNSKTVVIHYAGISAEATAELISHDWLDTRLPHEENQDR